MTKYDKYYEEEHHFGDPSPELIAFFAGQEERARPKDTLFLAEYFF
ncbi:MAG: putative tRNA (cytidine(34)-2'-O)-methyltransferase [Candidatus Thorarchaeota archaeon]|nr:MAG: putative tRNA (cytidine(34)-2'-O)-methyltransferase [Candidatus Thorarchaeota archaeon]